MSSFSCPICRRELFRKDRSLQCPSGHSFDLAKRGYVNLLCSQQSKLKRHGDDKRMLQARRAFLDSGAYAALRDALTVTVDREVNKTGILLDAGCGEGYYTAHIAEQCSALTVCGIDISKDALHMAATRTDRVELAVASTFALPIADHTLDGVVSVFAPCAEAEFARVLKPNGTLIRVIPTAQHLFGLKAAIYETPRPNKPERIDLDGFTLCHRQEIEQTLTLTSREDIHHLFEMTPYFYKTGQDDQARLLSRQSLVTEIAFAILTYRKL